MIVGRFVLDWRSQALERERDRGVCRQGVDGGGGGGVYMYKCVYTVNCAAVEKSNSCVVWMVGGEKVVVVI